MTTSAEQRARTRRLWRIAAGVMLVLAVLLAIAQVWQLQQEAVPVSPTASVQTTPQG